jgi:hemoglobin-like flavoprotein
MTPEHQDLVQESFKKIAPIADQAAVIFYDELFSRDPSLRPMFSDDMTEQRRKLMAMLGTAVANLKSWDAIEAAIRTLGTRHVTYGVKPSQYETVGAALIATLEKGLGEGFTHETRDAWVACYTAVSSEMLNGAAVS